MSSLLHCKQTFISQLKSGAMGARTIDEGAMDEKSGMNFSEYMALLSGNTDLLDKAKLEKRIASLEGERKSFNKGKRDSEFKLEAKTGELRNNTAVIEAMTEDWNRFLSVVQTDKEGNRLNAVKVDGVDSTDEKVLGKRSIRRISSRASIPCSTAFSAISSGRNSTTPKSDRLPRSLIRTGSCSS